LSVFTVRYSANKQRDRQTPVKRHHLPRQCVAEVIKFLAQIKADVGFNLPI